MIRIAIPLNSRLLSFWTEVNVDSHHSIKVSAWVWRTCWRLPKFSQAATVDHTSWAKGQSRQRWRPVSSGPLQRMQLSWWGHPLRARLSTFPNKQRPFSNVVSSDFWHGSFVETTDSYQNLENVTIVLICNYAQVNMAQHSRSALVAQGHRYGKWAKFELSGPWGYW